MTEQANPTKDLKFYSQRAIGLATFLGGPLAAGFLIRENYAALDKPEQGKKALYLGIIATLILFGGIFMIPDGIFDKVPTQIIPAIYTGIIYLIVEKIHGKVLNQHKENDNNFQPIWRAVVVGLISLALLLAGIFGYAYLTPEREGVKKYEAKLGEFFSNEEATMVFYEHLETHSSAALLKELKTEIIPKWEENVEIMNEASQIENLDAEYLNHSEVLLRYSRLRIKEFTLFKNAIVEDTDQYDAAIIKVQEEMNKELELLN